MFQVHINWNRDVIISNRINSNSIQIETPISDSSQIKSESI